MWNIWKARNNVVLRNKIFDIEEVFVVSQINTEELDPKEVWEDSVFIFGLVLEP